MKIVVLNDLHPSEQAGAASVALQYANFLSQENDVEFWCSKPRDIENYPSDKFQTWSFNYSKLKRKLQKKSKILRFFSEIIDLKVFFYLIWQSKKFKPDLVWLHQIGNAIPKTVPLVLPHLDPAQKELLSNELSTQEQFFSSDQYALLPSGASHCDLFRDNVLFDAKGALDTGDTAADHLGGFFDFYFAGNDKWLFDLAVTANDWCLAENQQDLDPERLKALINAYQSIRPLTQEEQASWPLMLRAAALRFWISRLWDFHLPRDAQMLTPHDPIHFEHILLSRRSL